MASRRRSATVSAIDDLADLAELLRVALAAGLTVTSAVGLVAPRLTTPAARAFAGAVSGGDLRSPVDELAALPDTLGEHSRELCAALVASARYGTPVLPALERVGFELRLARRLAAETRARHVSVLLLLPLVCCILPAFVLLAIVPVAIGALSTLPGVGA
jgi:pilus assembly protein TadC